MQLKHFLSGVALWSAAVVASHGAAITMDFPFSTIANPSSFSVAGLPGGTATATITVGLAGLGYGATADEFGLNGSATGMWGTQSGQFLLGLNQTASSSTLNYNLIIDQYVGFGGLDSWAYPGTVSFSIPYTTKGDLTAVSGTEAGQSGWYRQSYRWENVTVPNAVSLAISPGAGEGVSGVLIMDRLQFSVEGPLSVVPEPIVTQSLAAAGLALFGLWWRRRKV